MISLTRKQKEDIARDIWRDLSEFASSSALKRIRGLLDIWIGDREPRCMPSQHAWGLFLPGLETSPWLDPNEFGFVRALIKAYPAIRGELASFIRTGELLTYNESLLPSEWRTLPLCMKNRRVTKNCRGFPVTGRLIRRVREESRYIHQFCFLSLAPEASLEEHVDPFNYLVSVHLCIDAPDEAGLRVAGETRMHKEGCLLAFDNSFEHAAWNKGPRQRFVLAVHALHPRLTEVEKAALTAIHPHLGRFSVGVRLTRPKDASTA